MSRSKKDEKILELGYSIEALENEIQNLEERLQDKHEKMWEIIQHNDRLTLTYEPYRPPGDKHEDVTFYGLIEENDSLVEKVLEKMEIIREQDENIERLYGSLAIYQDRVAQLERSLVEMKTVEKAPRIPFSKPRIKNERWWNFSVELWPGAWGLNYYRYNWKKYEGTSREGNFQIGPFGFSWNREPKR